MASATSSGFPNLRRGICAVKSFFRLSENPGIVRQRKGRILNQKEIIVHNLLVRQNVPSIMGVSMYPGRIAFARSGGMKARDRSERSAPSSAKTRVSAVRAALVAA